MFGFLVVLIGCATKSLSGQVTTQGNLPLANVECNFLEQKALTDETGAFTFANLSLSKGEYDILCTRSGFEFVEETLDISGAKYIAPTFTMVPLSVEIPYLELNMDPEAPLQ